MNSSSPDRRKGQRANVRIIVVVLVAFLLGVAVSGFWFYLNARSGTAAQSGEGGARGSLKLSENTRAVLGRLDSPLEIRYYCLLDPAGLPDSVKAFAVRVDQLLSEYEKEGAGKITVARFKSDSDANAAFKDGISGFNLDKGNGCYLGLAIARNQQKQLLPRLSPEWEPALESDVTRAIAALVETKSPAQRAEVTVKADAAVSDEVKRLVPKFDTITVEEGTRMLREAALSEFSQAAQETEAQVKEAQQRLLQAQKGTSAADQQAAMQQLQQVQADQTQKLKQIAARSQARVEALKQLKAAAH